VTRADVAGLPAQFLIMIWVPRGLSQANAMITWMPRGSIRPMHDHEADDHGLGPVGTRPGRVRVIVRAVSWCFAVFCRESDTPKKFNYT
jgi:hypothetical protein